MAIQLFDYLNSINMTKKNLVRTAQDPSMEERSFPTFMGMRFLSYHEDALFLVNELNQVATVECGLTPQQHYEFLLHVLPKSKRFAKWQKSDKDEAIELAKVGEIISTDEFFDDVQLEGEPESISVEEDE